MKKIVFLKFLMALVVITGMQSCENEPLEGEFVAFPTNDDPSNLTCEQASTEVQDASIALSTATSDNYNTACTALQVALTNQIGSCGDSTGVLQATIDALGDCTNPDGNGGGDGGGDGGGGTTGSSQGCNGVPMRDFFGNIESCNYNFSVVLNEAYIEERGTSDADNDGVDDHSLTVIYFTDGTVTLDEDSRVVSIENATYSLNLFLYSLGTDGFVPGFFDYFDIDTFETSAYMSSSSDFGMTDCSTTGFFCDDSTVIYNGVVDVSGGPGNYELCFDALVDLDENCLTANYSGDFITVVDF